ncbi:MAG: hypothetical protein HN842_02660 [Gammaproteobacteria bacterium]|nr:hypothetical protein [Gammaproteobacteria bacterium]
MDSMINGAIEKFGESKPPTPPYFDTAPIPIEEAEEKLQEAIYKFTEATFFYWQEKRRENRLDPSTWCITPAPTLAIRAAAGIGKTTQIISKSIRSGAFGEGDIEFYVPSHTLSEELEEKLREELDIDLSDIGAEDYTRVRIIKGRDQADQDGVVLCLKSTEATQIAQLGLSVRKSLCDDGEQRCEFYSECGYQAQFHPSPKPEEDGIEWVDFNPAVRVLAHNHLFLHTRDTLPEPRMIVVDESFYQRGIEKIILPISELISIRSEITNAIFNALYDGYPLLLKLRERGITPTQLYDKANEIQEREQLVTVNPSMPHAQQVQRLSEAGRPSRVTHLLKALGDELAITDRDQSHCVQFNENHLFGARGIQPAVIINQRKELTIPSHIPMIFIDADLNPNILHQFKPHTPVVKIPVERQAEVIQFSDLTFSKNALVNNEEQVLLEQTKEFINNVSATGQTLVVSSLAVRRAITGEQRGQHPRVGEYNGVSMVHFGMLRGLDAFKEYDNVIIVGREQPPVESLEELTGGLWWDDSAPINFQSANESGGISLINEKRGYRMRDGSSESVQTQVHPDHRAQQILEQIRESESTQAIDRLRLVRPNERESNRRVFVLSNVPLDITVDHLVGWKEYQRILEIWKICDGVMPTKPEHLLLAAPDLVGSLGSAKRYARDIKKIMFLISYFVRDMGIFKVRYRPANSNGRMSVAYVSSGRIDPKRVLERVIGEEVETEEGRDQSEE